LPAKPSGRLFIIGGVAVVLIIVIVVFLSRHSGGRDLTKDPNYDPAGLPPAAKYKIGDSTTTAGVRVTVYALHDPQPPGPLRTTPPTGEHFVTVDVQVNNPGTTPIVLSSLAAFHLIDKMNNEYARITAPGLQLVAPDGRFAAGRSVRELVLFKVVNGTTGFRLRFQGRPTDPGVVFTLS